MKKESLTMYFSEVKKHNVLTDEVQKELIAKAQQGDESARNQLITSNLRFVVKIAKQYVHHAISLSEIIAEGNLGLITAINKFDLDQKNITFISYATWWIKHFITRLLQQSGCVVRLPINQMRLLKQIEKEQTQLINTKQLSYQDSLEVIAKNYKIGTEDIITLKNLSREASSLDAKIETQDHTITLMESLSNKNDKTTNEIIEYQNEYELINKYIVKIPRREARIIQQRYGLNNTEPKSLSTLSKEYGITKERVRQLEMKGIQRIKKLLQESIRNPIALEPKVA